MNSKSNTNSLPKSVVTTYNGSQPTGECEVFQRFNVHMKLNLRMLRQSSIQQEECSPTNWT